MQLLTPNFREEVTAHIFKSAFDMNTLITTYPEIIEKIIVHTIPSLEQPDNEILSQGNEASHFYFIADGKCKTFVTCQNHEEVEVFNDLEKGNYFGEISILHDCLISATVKTINYCTFAKISKEFFLTLCKCFLGSMKNLTYKYDDPFIKFKMSMLERVDYFNEIIDNENLLNDLQFHMVEENFEEDIMIISNGDTCEKLYFIAEGKVQIEIQNE